MGVNCPPEIRYYLSYFYETGMNDVSKRVNEEMNDTCRNLPKPKGERRCNREEKYHPLVPHYNRNDC